MLYQLRERYESRSGAKVFEGRDEECGEREKEQELSRS